MVARIYPGDKAERSRAATKRYRDSHPEKVKDYLTKYRAEHKDELSDSFRKYYLEHHDEMLERARKRRAEHPEDKRVSSRKRKAIVRGSNCELTTREIRELLTECLFCGSKEKLTLAHNIPVSRGGKTNKENTFCLCSSCNSRMNTMTLDELIDKRKIRKDQESYCWLR